MKKNLELIVVLALLNVLLLPGWWVCFGKFEHPRESLRTIQALKYGQAFFDERIARVVQKADFTFIPGFENGLYTLKIQMVRGIERKEIVLKGKDF